MRWAGDDLGVDDGVARPRQREGLIDARPARRIAAVAEDEHQDWPAVGRLPHTSAAVAASISDVAPSAASVASRGRSVSGVTSAGPNASWWLEAMKRSAVV